MIGVLIGVPAKLKKLLDIITPGRMGNLDNLDVPVSSRAPAATALSTSVWTNAHADAVLAAAGGASKSILYQTPGAFSFIVPTGVSLIWVTLQAPGGGGGKNINGGAGGGAGELIRRWPYPCAPGQVINGNNGSGVTGNTIVTSTFGALTAHGGHGGLFGINGGSGGGALGAAGGVPPTPGAPGGWQAEVLGGSSGGSGGGTFNAMPGGPCGAFAGGALSQWSGGGGASYFAAGGAANHDVTPAQPGPGAGAGGTTNGVQAPGGDGIAMIEWIG